MPPVVVLDACVLYPAAQRDLFMWLATGGVIRAHWTNEIHDEWMRNVEQDFGIARSILERVRKLMDRAAGDAVVTHYRKHERLFPNTHAKDRHVAAAAVTARNRSKANIVTIITWNLRDFDRKELAAVGVVAQSPDTFLSRLLADSPEAVIAAFKRMRDNLRNPTKTTRECADALASQGLKKFAGAIMAMLE
jgi:hypothetical protein